MAKKSSKKLPLILGILALLLIGGGTYVFFNFNIMLTRTAEKIATGALGVNVDIGTIGLSLKEKSVTVNSIKIDNPPGFKTPYAIAVDEVHIALNTATRDLIDFKDVSVKGSTVNFEVNQNGMNLLALKNLANQKKQKEATGSEAIRVIVEKMVIEASTVKPTITIIDREFPDFNLPAINISRIGQSGASVSVDQALNQILEKYIGHIQAQARKEGLVTGIPDAGEAKAILNKAKDKVFSIFE